MKRFWFLLTIFYAIIHQKHLTTTAVNTLKDKIIDGLKFANKLGRMLEDASNVPPGLSEAEDNLINDICGQIIAVIQQMTTPEAPLENDDRPAVLNFVNPHGDTLLDGNLKNLISTYADTLVLENLHMYNVKIDGFKDIEEGDISTVVDELEIRIAVNVKQLVIHGEYVVETLTIGIDEKFPFSVTLTNVRIEGVAYMMLDQYENMRLTNIVPTILSEDTHVSTESKIAPNGEILKLALTSLENRVTLSFAQIAMLEMSMNCPQRGPDDTASPKETAIYELRKLVNQCYDPLKICSVRNFDDQSPSLRLGPFNLHGLSNFELNDTQMVVTNSSMKIIVKIDIKNLRGNSSLFFRQAYVGTFSIGKIEFIGRIALPMDNSTTVPIIENLGMDMSDCRWSFRNKATGTPVTEKEFRFDAEDIFCQLIRSQISTQSIMEAIQYKIFNHVDFTRRDLASSLSLVELENQMQVIEDTILQEKRV